MRKTKITCVIESASDNGEMLKKLMFAGMNVTRFNLPHDAHGAYAEKFKHVVKLRRELGLPVTTLLDTEGPEIRLRDFKSGPKVLEKSTKFTLTTRGLLGDNTIVSMSHKDLPSDAWKGGVILIDDGLINLRVDGVGSTKIHCAIKSGGKASNHKGVNIPGANLSISFISDQDRSDVEFGCQVGFDYIMASLTRTATDIRTIHKIPDAHGNRMKIVARIESVQDMKNIEEAFKETDGVMVARGDLGVEAPAEDIPVVQKNIIKLGAKIGRIIITAIQMLDSMIHNPQPTRAEIMGVIDTVYDGTMAIMLSGETVAGSCPVKAVEMIDKIAEKTEQDINYNERKRRLETEKQEDTTTATSHTTYTAAEDVRTKTIVTITISGFTARRLAKYHPECPVIVCTVGQMITCQVNLLLDVTPMLIPQEGNTDILFDAALHETKKFGLVSEDDTAILATDLPLDAGGNMNMICVMEMT